MVVTETVALVGLDGTGSDWLWREPQEYREAFRNSHVRRLCDGWRGPREYYAGPRVMGFGTQGLATKAVYSISRMMNATKGVVLAGYSRGGAAAVVAAQHLGRMRVPVRCLLLFDAVDRSLAIGSTMIPKNVEVVFHAMRDPRTSSRESFGNCGLRVADEGATRYVTKRFLGTHGALGGVPWTIDKEKDRKHRAGRNRRPGAPGRRLIREGGVDQGTNVSYDEDDHTAGEVWKWMNANLRSVLPSYA